ncbi:glycine cleavage system protein H [Amycolatopsis alkalitolerans]|uniref:Glycine cleavage system protein H n=1 Tax=Amycolatopsis alkalitolerans TaxID=2547244 RepID=A0A5C4M1P5_9PSEU|nr:glycine cleavage system protein H [Amycolatopsis alkalitolerans]
MSAVTDVVWRGCVVPDDLLYDVGMNVWVRPEGDVVVLGMTDIAQTMGGRMVQITWRRVGKAFARGKSVATIESAKWVGPFPTPLTGELVASNEKAFAEDIAVANRDPYGAGWIARVRPERFAEEREHLVDGHAAMEAYREFMAEHDIHCYRCAE